MKTFKQFRQSINEHHILYEGRSRGEAMEEVIVAAVNGSPQGDDTFGIDAEAGVKVAQFLKKTGISGKAKVLGADTIEVSNEWSRFWDGSVPASTKTPKTDFMVGNAKISLKSGDAAQLMSGGKNESLATFYTALSKTSNIENHIADKLTDMFENLAPASVAPGDLRSVIAQKKDEIVTKADQAHKSLMTELKTIFNNNTDFRNAFAYEAMSGETKFGGNDGTCTHFLVTTFDGEQSSIHSVSDKSYVSKIANQMKVSVRFKTTSVKRKIGGRTQKTGEYRYWSVIGLIVDKMQEDLEHNADNLLTEASIMDFFRRVWQRIKAALLKAVNYVRKSPMNVFKFLEVEPEISFNNNVRF